MMLFTKGKSSGDSFTFTDSRMQGAWSRDRDSKPINLSTPKPKIINNK